jgi:hypothetical protein
VLNAGRQEERASQQPIGPARDRALAWWGPLDAVTEPVGLQGPRAMLDGLRDLGDDELQPVLVAADGSAADAGSTPTTAPTTATTAPDGAAPVAETTTSTTVPPPPPPPRTPTAEAPLRVLVVGDSTMREPGMALQQVLATTGVAVSHLDQRASSGLSRPDFFDWPGHLAALIPEHSAEVVVIMFGGNDAQGFVVDGVVFDFGTPEWIAEYGNRVNATMALASADGRRVVWIGQPVMKSESFDSKISLINQIYIDQATAFPGVTFLDSRPILTPDGYRGFGPGVDGSESQLRASDGIHLAPAGGDLLAAAVLGQLTGLGYLPPAG